MSDDEKPEVREVQGAFVTSEKKDAPIERKDMRNVSVKSLHSAFFDSIAHKMRKAEADAYSDLLNSMRGIHEAEAGVAEAKHQKDRIINKLLDAEKIHEADKLEREANLNKAKAEAFRSEEFLKEQEHEAEISAFYRETERRNMESQKEEILNETRNVDRGFSKSEEELWDRLTEAIEPLRVDTLVYQFIQDHELSEEQIAEIQKIAEDFKKANS